jgi:hypothetical protein
MPCTFKPDDGFCIGFKGFVLIRTGGEQQMKDQWEELISCAIECTRCEKKLSSSDQRILSVYDHQTICMACKKEEEQRKDYEEVSKNAIGTCMAETEILYSDPAGYCYHHFYPYTCEDK